MFVHTRRPALVIDNPQANRQRFDFPCNSIRFHIHNKLLTSTFAKWQTQHRLLSDESGHPPVVAWQAVLVLADSHTCVYPALVAFHQTVAALLKKKNLRPLTHLCVHNVWAMTDKLLYEWVIKHIIQAFPFFEVKMLLYSSLKMI